MKNKTWRSEKHRRAVAGLDCIVCGRYGPSQAAHVNFGKGMGLKASDALIFPACPSCHTNHDQGGINKIERWKREYKYVSATRSLMLRNKLWSDDVERAYWLAISPLAVAAQEG
jgi:hypothetical protein